MNLAIFGSCVTRDAFAIAPVEGICVVDYLARSSLASAFYPLAVGGWWMESLKNIESAFQRRMVEIDMRKGAREILQASKADMVLVDLIDERFRVVGLGESFATWSTEFSRLNLDSAKFANVLHPGSPVRQELWLKGARELVRCVGADRLVLNEIFWATHTSEGQELQHHEKILEANCTLKNMYSQLHSMGVEKNITYPIELFSADPEHKWGVSPFHYGPELYRETMSQVAQLSCRQ